MKKDIKKQFTVWLKPSFIEVFRAWSKTQKESNGDLVAKGINLLMAEVEQCKKDDTASQGSGSV